MTHRFAIRSVLASFTILLLVSCAEASQQDFCTQYADLVTAAATLQDQDPLTAKAEDLATAADEFRAELDQFQAVSEGRLDTAISTLRAQIDAVRQSAEAELDEALDAARPLLEDSLKELSQGWAALQAVADTQCG